MGEARPTMKITGAILQSGSIAASLATIALAMLGRGENLLFLVPVLAFPFGVIGSILLSRSGTAELEFWGILAVVVAAALALLAFPMAM